MTQKPSWGAIFDFDGVIVDTERHHEVCWQQVAKERNSHLTHEQYVAGFGLKNERFIVEILGWTNDKEEIDRIARRKEEIFLEHAKVNKIDLIPGVESFLAAIHARGIPCGIASSSILKNIEVILEHSPVRRYFSQIVSGEDVTQGKPHPSTFLCAAKKLKLAPERCVVFEDALLGVEGAHLAGTKVVAITTTFVKERFEALAFCPDLIISRFDESVLREVEQWFSCIEL